MRFSISGPSALERCRQGLIALAALVAVTLVATPAEARVLAGYEQGYARIVIRDQNITKPRIDQNDGLLFLSFDKSLSADISDVADKIPRAVSAARMDPDGRAIRFAMTREFRINATRAGDELYIDILPTNWSGPMPALPPEAIERLSDLAEATLVRRDGDVPAVEFRYGVHPTFARLSFLWEGAVSADLSREDDQIEVAFSAGGKVDLTALKQSMPEELQEVRAGLRDGRLVVQIQVQPSVPVRGFWDEGAYVIDVTTSPSSTLNELNIAPQSGLDAAPARAEPLRPEASTSLAPSASAPAPVVEAAPRETPSIRDVRLAPVPSAAAREAETLVETTDDRVAVSFGFANPTPAAVFERGSQVWLVFGTEEAIDAEGVRVLSDGLMEAASLARQDGLAVMALTLTERRIVEVWPEGNVWNVAFAQKASRVSRSLAPLRTLEASEAGRIDFPVQGAAVLRQIEIEGLGSVELTLALEGPQGLPIAKSYVAFEALKSAQGLALLPIRDGLSLAKTDEGVSAGVDGGLAVAQARRAYEMLANEARIGKAGPRVTFANETRVTDIERAAQLMRRSAMIEDEAERLDARMTLAEHYIAHRMGPEALSVLNAVREAEPSAARGPDFALFTGIGYTLVGRTPAAREALRSPALLEDPEARLWSAISYVQDGRWNEADRAFRDGEGLLAHYPPRLQAFFRLAAARAGLERRDVAFAAQQLERLVVDELDAGQLDERALLVGRFSELVGRLEEAGDIYRAVADNAARPDSYEAQVRLASLSEEAGDLTREDAIKRLRALAIGWRGDPTEIYALHRLAVLEVEAGNPRGAFEAMRTAVLSRPDLDATAALQTDMGDAFERLFLDGGADGLDTVEALALYYDFNDLTPVGPKGDDMIRRLAARLVSVDLLPQAAELLDYQIENRLRGAAKAQVAAQLALIHLMDGRPAAALTALSRTRQGTLPRAVQEDRRLLEARALLETNRVDLALETLSVLETPRAQALRADALWQAERWQEAGEEMERIIGRAYEGTVPLTEAQRRHGLRAAIAYTLSGDGVSLARIRGNLVDKMDGTPDETAFAVVSKPLTDSAVAFASVAGGVAARDDLTAFLDDYKARFFKPEPAQPAEEEPVETQAERDDGLTVAMN